MSEFEEQTPNWDYQEHKRKAEDLGQAVVNADESQRLYDSKNRITKNMGYEKYWVANSQKDVEERRRKYDEQLEKAASHKDMAHEQALGYVELASNYQEAADLLRKELGINAPERSAQDIAEGMMWEHVPYRDGGSGDWEWRTRDQDRGIILALRETLTPFVEVDGKYTKRARRLREGIGVTADEAAKLLEQEPDKKFLKITTGSYNDRSGRFYHKRYEVKYLPLPESVAEMIGKIDTSTVDSAVRLENGGTERTNFDLVSADSIREALQEKTAPIKLEINHETEGKYPGETDRIVSEFGFDDEETARQKILEILLDQPGIYGEITVNGKDISLKEFMLGVREQEEQAA